MHICMHARLSHGVVGARGGSLEDLVPVIHETLHDEVVGRATLVECTPERQLLASVGRREELEAEPRAVWRGDGLALPHHAWRIRLELSQLELGNEHRVRVARRRVAGEVNALTSEAALHRAQVRGELRGRHSARRNRVPAVPRPRRARTVVGRVHLCWLDGSHPVEPHTLTRSGPPVWSPSARATEALLGAGAVQVVREVLEGGGQQMLLRGDGRAPDRTEERCHAGWCQNSAKSKNLFFPKKNNRRPSSRFR